MKNLMMDITSSSKELKSVRNLTLCGVLLAIKVVLSAYGTLRLAPTIQIGTSFIVSAAIGLILGPFVGGLTGAASDIISYMMFPDGPFSIAFTLLSVLSGSLYGFLLYNKKVTILRCFITELIIICLVNVILNTMLLSILWGKAFMEMVYVRLTVNAIQIPIKTFIMYVVLKEIEKFNLKRNSK